MTAMFNITSNNKTPQLLRRHSCLHLLRWRNNGGLMTAHSGRVYAKSISNRGTAWVCVTSTQPGIWEWLDLGKDSDILWERKNSVHYHYKVVVYTHCQHHIYVQTTCKIEFCIRRPLTFHENHFILHKVLKFYNRKKIMCLNYSHVFNMKAAIQMFKKLK